MNKNFTKFITASQNALNDIEEHNVQEISFHNNEYEFYTRIKFDNSLWVGFRISNIECDTAPIEAIQHHITDMITYELYKNQVKKQEYKDNEINIPKYPLARYALPHSEGTNGSCPNCQKTVNSYSEREKCSCGQLLKWNR